mgnify:CR=1 FL=1
MGRIAGVPNKLTIEVKERLRNIVLKSIDTIDIETLTTAQKIKLIQIGVQYIIPRLKHSDDLIIDKTANHSLNFRELFNFEKS